MCLENKPPKPMLLRSLTAWRWQEVRKDAGIWEKQTDPAEGMDCSQDLSKALLAPQEQSLLERLAIEGGACPVDDWAQCRAALSLARRGWVNNRFEEEKQTVVLKNGEKVFLPQNRDYDAPSSVQWFSFQASIHGLLYLYGALPQKEAMGLLGEHLHMGAECLWPSNAAAFFAAAYDLASFGGETYLLHPALWEVEPVLEKRREHDLPAEIDTGLLFGAMQELLPEEAQSHQAVVAALAEMGVEGEAGEELATEIRLFTKQDVEIAQLKAAASEALGGPLSSPLIAGLVQMHREVVRW